MSLDTDISSNEKWRERERRKTVEKFYLTHWFSNRKIFVIRRDHWITSKPTNVCVCICVYVCVFVCTVIQNTHAL